MVTPPTEDIAVFLEAAGRAGVLIGLDLGTKTIGVAVSDPSRKIATPLETIARKKFSVDQLRLAEIGQSRAASGFVIGLPNNLDGSAGPRVQATRAFACNLFNALEVPILFWDERLTTVEAERMLIAADQSRKRRAEVIDKLAATLILQGVLDRLTVYDNHRSGPD